MNIIKNRRNFFAFSGILVTLSLFLLVFWGLRPGIDFTGGVLLEAKSDAENFNRKEIESAVSGLELKGLTIQKSEESAVIRFISNEDDLNEKVVASLQGKYENLEVERMEFISGTISEEIKYNAVVAIFVALVAIVLYIAWAFRGVGYPVSSWKYGIIAIIALVHDILITLGAFAILGKIWQVEVGVPFIAALLTIFGYSVNDTIIIFDRIRENLIKKKKEKFKEVIEESLWQTMARSINTSFTVIIVLLAIIFFGSESILHFSLALLIGFIAGSYSSIFVAGGLLVEAEKMKARSGRLKV